MTGTYTPRTSPECLPGWATNSSDSATSTALATKNSLADSSFARWWLPRPSNQCRDARTVRHSAALRKHHVLLWKNNYPPQDPHEYAAARTLHNGSHWTVHTPLVHTLNGIDYLTDGDVVRIDSNGYVRTLFRKNSPNNFILTTDQCNSYCLICSQPPKQVNDFDHVAEHIRLIDLIDPETRELVITGGEPTLLKNEFIRLIERCKEKLPRTAIHVLTN